MADERMGSEGSTRRAPTVVARVFDGVGWLALVLWLVVLVSGIVGAIDGSVAWWWPLGLLATGAISAAGAELHDRRQRRGRV